MKLKADISQMYPGSMYKVQIIDTEDEKTFPPQYIESVPARYYSQFLWSAKLRAKLSMKKIYKAYNFNPPTYEVVLEAK